MIAIPLSIHIGGGVNHCITDSYEYKQINFLLIIKTK